MPAAVAPPPTISGSMRATLRRASASSRAHAAPTIPAPATTTSKELGETEFLLCGFWRATTKGEAKKGRREQSSCHRHRYDDAVNRFLHYAEGETELRDHHAHLTPRHHANSY